MVWRVKNPSPLALSDPQMAGQVFVSMRGTQEGQDLLDDVSLAAAGLPGQQLIDMTNWWLRITTAPTAQAQQIAWTFGETDPVTGAVRTIQDEKVCKGKKWSTANSSHLKSLS